MGYLSYNEFKAFKNYLGALAQSTHKVLICGENASTKQSFTKFISIERNKRRLLSCAHLDIHPISFYSDPLKRIRSFLQKHLGISPTSSYYMDDAAFINHYISRNLYFIHLSLGPIEYYILSTQQNILLYRAQKFKIW